MSDEIEIQGAVTAFGATLASEEARSAFIAFMSGAKRLSTRSRRPTDRREPFLKPR
jgi:hypothetical protein